MISALLAAAALSLSFFVRTTASPFAVAWFVLISLSCLTLFIEGKNEIKKDFLFYLLVTWIGYLSIFAFFIKVSGTSYFFWSAICTFPIYFFALSKNPGSIKSHILTIGSVLTFLALFTCYQYIDNPSRIHYPLINPNNLAAILNVGLIGSIGLILKNKKYFPLLVVFILSIIATGSKGAIVSAFLAGLLISCDKGKIIYFFLVTIPSVFIADKLNLLDKAILSLQDRYVIWEASLKIVDQTPFFGFGLGTFYKLYSHVKEEWMIRMFAHNDLLQLYIEAGVISVVLYILIFAFICFNTTKKNIIPFSCLFVVILHSQISFHFFLPSIGILLGLSLAYWRYLCTKHDQPTGIK